MAIVAGIDEAGLGPVLGPLVVSGVAFRVRSEQMDECLWSLLSSSCTSKLGKSSRRLVIADSKKLFRPRESLAPLERAALVMLAVAGHKPQSWRSLLDQIAPGATKQLDAYPWYRGIDFPLPVSEGTGDVATRSNSVTRDCQENGVELLPIVSDPLPAGHFNRLVKNIRNKSVVSLGMTLAVADRLLSYAQPDEPIRLIIDRQGGRTHYREPLMTSLPTFQLEILKESASQSAYRLTRSSRVVEFHFVTKAEQVHMAVALASVYSKYLRELYMAAFNRFWSREIPGLRSTAGYYTDAIRWLNDAAPGIARHGIDRDILARCR